MTFHPVPPKPGNHENATEGRANAGAQIEGDPKPGLECAYWVDPVQITATIQDRIT